MDNNNTDTALKEGLDNEKISLGRLMCCLSIALFLSGIILDLVSTPELVSEILTVRLFMCFSLSIAFVSTFKRKLFLEYYTHIISVLFLGSAFAIQYMIYITDPTSLAHSTYFAGLILTIITVFLGTYISNRASIFISLIIITTFGMMSFYISPVNYALAVNNGFFLVSSLIVGIISNSMKNKFMARNLILQKRLKESLRHEQNEVARQSELANYDTLTKVANRRHGKYLLEEMRKQSESLGMIMVVLFIDLNKFKLINDTYGHSVGDEVLHICSSRLINTGRKSDILMRHGGDEFVYGMLLEKTSTVSLDARIDKIIHSLRDNLKAPMKVDELRLAIDASIGKAIYPYNGNNVQQLIDVADVKMYENKKELKAQEREIKGRGFIPETPDIGANVAAEYLNNIHTDDSTVLSFSRYKTKINYKPR